MSVPKSDERRRLDVLAVKLYAILSKEDKGVGGLVAALDHEYLPQEIDLVLNEYRIIGNEPQFVGEGMGGGWRGEEVI